MAGRANVRSRVGAQGVYLLRWILAGVLLAGVVDAGTPPGNATLPKDTKLPAHVSVAVYLPAQMRRFHGFVHTAFDSGRTMEDAVLSAGQLYFVDSHMAEAGADTPYGLLLALHPDIKNESGHLLYTVNWAVFADGEQALLKGTESATITAADPMKGDPFDRAAFETTQRIMSTMIAGLHPDEAKFPAVLSLKARALEFAASTDKPWGNGTGFYFNANGQILTAAHVVQNCIRIDVKREDKVLPAKVQARSSVVDLAVLETGAPSPAVLPFRRALNIELGEPITSVGYPLQSILAAMPNLTRGNVSARAGLTGSVGQFQFSAPTQPGMSGGPIVSDGGEVLGVTVGTLNAVALAKQGIIPQNVNFALEARYAAKFLEKNNLSFTAADANLHGDAHAANQAALAAVVDVQCYE